MHIGSAVNGKPFIIRELLTPAFLVSVDRPIITVEPAPKNCFAVLIKELLRYHPAVITFDIHNADGIIALPVDGNGITPYDIQ